MCPVMDTRTQFYWVYGQSWSAGPQVTHMFYISIDSKELSKVAIPISTPTRSTHEFRLLHIAPKMYFKWIMSSQGNTGNPWGSERKTKSKLKPPIKWNLNRKLLLVWEQSQSREYFWLLGGWEARPSDLQNGGVKPEDPWMKKNLSACKGAG